MLHLLPLTLLLSPLAPAAPAQEPEPAPEAAPSVPGIVGLTLEDVVRLAAESGPALQQARLQSLAAAGEILEADGTFDPVLFADLTYTFAEAPASGFFTNFGNTESKSFVANQGIRQALSTGGSLTLTINEQFSEQNFLLEPQASVNAGIEFTQPLLRGAWNLTATQALVAAGLRSDRELAGVRQAQLDVVQAAVDAYWDLSYALADLEVKRRSLALADGLRELTEAKYRVGAVAEVEVVQTEADIATRTDALLTAAKAVDTAEDQLRVLLYGLADGSEWDLKLRPRTEAPAPSPQDLGWEAAFADAREFRADLRQLRIDVETAELDWQVAKRGTKPKLDFTASGSYTSQESQVGDAFDALSDRDFPGYTLGLVFEMPLGNQTFEGAEVRTRYRMQLARRQLRDRENEVANEVREAVRDLRYNAERVSVTATARDVAARQLEAEQLRLREGASTNFQVLQFQTDLAAAESSAARARADYAKALTRLNLVRGLDWEGSRPDLADLDRYRPDGGSR
ncbi:MAG: TolC family protein [Planctomycetota bacterium]|jgi:outer membrane protein TolC